MKTILVTIIALVAVGAGVILVIEIFKRNGY
jgi:hypothetical protein